MQRKLVRELVQIIFETECRPRLVVMIIRDGNYGVQSVIAAGELQHHQNGVVLAGHWLRLRRGLSMQRVEGMRKKGRNGPRDCTAQNRRPQELPACFQIQFVHIFSKVEIQECTSLIESRAKHRCRPVRPAPPGKRAACSDVPI